MIAALPFDPAARAQWVHDLRNAMNLLGIGTTLSRRLLDAGRIDEAQAAIAECVHAWERCRDLLVLAPEATRLSDVPTTGRAATPTASRPSR